MVDEPPNRSWRVVKEVFPKSNSSRNVAAVIAFLIDTTGKPEPETMSIVDVRGDSSYAKAVCAAIPQVRFAAPEEQRRRSLLLVPFVSFRGSAFPGEFMALPDVSLQKLQAMSTVERREFLIDKGCRRFK